VTRDITLTAKWQYAPLRTVTLAQDPAGIGTNITGNGTYNEGSQITVSVEANNACYTFDGWWDGTTKKSDDLSFPYTVTGDVTLTAKWTRIKYTITLTSDNLVAGTITVNGSASPVEVNCGSTITLNAVAEPGYTFEGWWVGSILFSNITNVSTTALESKTYTAKWGTLKYNFTLTESPSAGGNIPSELTDTYDFGSSQTLPSPTDNTGYTWDGWYKDGTGTKLDGGSKTPTVTVGTTNNYTATWTPNKYGFTFTISPTGAGSITNTLPGTYDFGSQQTLPSPDDNTGYTWDGWYKDGTGTKLDGGSKTPAVTVGTTNNYTAKWLTNQYTVTLAKDPSGAPTPTGGGVAESGSTLTLNAGTSSCYTFDGWYDGTNKISASTSFAYTVTGDVTLTAKWAVQTRQVTLTNNNTTAGTILVNSNNSPQSVNCGSTATLKATANTGYTFDGWYDSTGTTKQSTSTTWVTPPINANITYIAKWTVNQYTVTLSKDPAGAPTPTGGGTATYSSQLSLTAGSNACYTFDGWYDGGSKISSSNSYTYTVTKNVTLIAKWTQNTYVVSVTKDIASAGNVTVNGTANSASVGCGNKVTLVATPNSGYEFLSWKDAAGTNVLSNNNPWDSDNSLTSAKTYTSSWRQINLRPFTLSKNRTKAAGALTMSNQQLGTQVSLPTVTPNTGYKFVGWKKNAAGDYLNGGAQNPTVTVETTNNYTAYFDNLYTRVKFTKEGSLDVSLSLNGKSINLGTLYDATPYPGTTTLSGAEKCLKITNSLALDEPETTINLYCPKYLITPITWEASIGNCSLAEDCGMVSNTNIDYAWVNMSPYNFARQGGAKRVYNAGSVTCGFPQTGFQYYGWYVNTSGQAEHGVPCISGWNVTDN
jgi:uncharacterized repeat protein (TIGR02543 family)